MRFLPAIGCLVILTPAVYAEISPTCADLLKKTAADIVGEVGEQTEAGREQMTRQVLGMPEIMAPCMTQDEALDTKLAKVIETRRIDKQVGASGGAAGSTTLVASGAAPKLLGLAVEHGAVAQAIAGSTVTFRTTPAKLIAALSKSYGPDAPLPDDRTIRALGRVSLSASFDTSRTATADSPNGTPLLANYRQLSEATLRIQLWNERDPLHRGNFAKIRELSQGKSATLYANQAAIFLRSVKRSVEYDAAVDEASTKIKASKDADGIEKALLAYAARLAALYRAQPEMEKRLHALVDSWVKSDQDHKALYRKIAKSPLFTFEYAFERPPIMKLAATGTAPAGSAAPASPLAPDHHTGRLIYAASILEAEYTLTASATWFHDARPDMRGMFRSFQFGGKLDIPVGEIPPLARGTLTFSGLYVNLHQKPLGFDLKIQEEKVNKPGGIGFFQAKYSIPLSDTGVSVPISLTVSNRTELIKEREVRGNIGLSFDLDKMLARK